MARLPTIDGDPGDWGIILNAFLEVSLNSDGTIQTGAIQQAGGITSINGMVPINQGGTGSSTKNFVDLSTVQTVAGSKTFSSGLSTTSLQVSGGTPGSGKVLTSDGSGNASWSAPSAGSISITSPGENVSAPGSTIEIGGTSSAPTLNVQRRDEFYLSDYGIFGDFSTDNGANFYTVLNSLVTANGGVAAVLPRGTIYSSTTFVIRP